MIVCEYTFTREDPHDSNYSMREVDWYAYVPIKTRNGVDNHRLTLRKNLVTEEYELCRASYHLGTGLRTGFDVIFKDRDLAKVVEHGNAELGKFWPDTDGSTVCTHTPEHMHRCCNGRRS